MLRLIITGSSADLESSLLAERVRRTTGAAKVALGEKIAHLWGGYGELRRAELELESGDASVVIKDVRPPAGEQGRSHRRKLRSYAVEQAFYRDYAERCVTPPRCRVPRALGLAAQDGGWLFVLEDLDAAGFAERCDPHRDAHVVATLRWLAGFHARFLGCAPRGLWPTGSYWHLATRPGELDAMPAHPLRDAAVHLDRELEAARYKTLIHGDAKPENVCLSPHGDEAALVDFQYAGGGAGVKDVAYFLSGCLSPGECRARVPGYVDVYFRELERALAAGGAAGDFAPLEREWRDLFPLAWLDYYRFLLGWAPGPGRDPYAELLVSQNLARLRSG